MTALEPDDRVHAPLSFICGTGLPGCGVSYYEKPERVIAGQILEDAGDWLAALKRLERRRIPDGVMTSVEAAYAAILGWVEWMDRAATAERRTPAKPRPPGAA